MDGIDEVGGASDEQAWLYRGGFAAVSIPGIGQGGRGLKFVLIRSGLRLRGWQNTIKGG